MVSAAQMISPHVMSSQTTEQWFAIHTRARHEKRVVQELSANNITTFLPLVIEKHRWSDRIQVVQLPLFSCYAFVAVDSAAANRVAVLRTPGVLGFVGSNHAPTPIPQSEIDGVRALLASTAQFSEHPFLKIGQKVRIRGGALDGLEGLLMARKGGHGLVISIDAIQRSLIVHVEGYALESM